MQTVLNTPKTKKNFPWKTTSLTIYEGDSNRTTLCVTGSALLELGLWPCLFSDQLLFFSGSPEIIIRLRLSRASFQFLLPVQSPGVSYLPSSKDFITSQSLLAIFSLAFDGWDTGLIAVVFERSDEVVKIGNLRPRNWLVMWITATVLPPAFLTLFHFCTSRYVKHSRGFVKALSADCVFSFRFIVKINQFSKNTRQGDSSSISR